MYYSCCQFIKAVLGKYAEFVENRQMREFRERVQWYLSILLTINLCISSFIHGYKKATLKVP